MQSRRLVLSLGILQVFIGLGAVAGGMGLILNPSGANLGLPIEMLEASPFATFLIPGIVLLAVNGLGSLAGALLTFTRRRGAGEAAIALGVFLMAWIVIQVYWVRGIHWLHFLYFVLGLVEHFLGRSMRKHT
jgi:hypothetical protein